MHTTARVTEMVAWYCSSSSFLHCRVQRFCKCSTSACCFSCSKKIVTGLWAVIALKAAGASTVGTANLPCCLDKIYGCMSCSQVARCNIVCTCNADTVFMVFAPWLCTVNNLWCCKTILCSCRRKGLRKRIRRGQHDALCDKCGGMPSCQSNMQPGFNITHMGIMVPRWVYWKVWSTINTHARPVDIMQESHNKGEVCMLDVNGL